MADQDIPVESIRPSPKKIVKGKRLRGFFAWMATAVRRLLSTAKLFENIALGAILAIIVSVVICCIALIERRVWPDQQLLLGTFNVVAADEKGTGDPALGVTVANLISDSLDGIIEDGASYKGNTYSSSLQWFAPRDLPKVPVSRDFDFQWKGVSFSQVMSILDLMRHQQFHISGEILPAPAEGGLAPMPMQWVIHARLTDRRTTTWISKPFAMRESEIRLATQSIAQQIMTSLNPEVAGRYYMAHLDYADASPVFAQWLETDPNNPEPNLWLARTLAMKGDVVAAENFANRAWSEATPGRWWHISDNRRKRIYKPAALLAMGYADERMKDFKEAEEKYKQDLDSPAALNNLGDLERRDLLDPGVAISNFSKAIDRESGYLTARVNLARALLDKKDIVGAEAEINETLGLNPFFPDAMELYLEIQLQMHRAAEGELYCKRWISPVVIKEVPASPTAYTYVMCAILEVRQSVPNLALITLYLKADKSDTSAPLRVGALNEIAGRLCDSKEALPTDAENSPESQAEAMRIFVQLVKLEASQNVRGRCIASDILSPARKPLSPVSITTGLAAVHRPATHPLPYASPK